MLDRGSAFQDDRVLDAARRYVCVAGDVWYLEQRRDATGDLYRDLVRQRGDVPAGRTSQGFYLFEPSGRLRVAWNNRSPRKTLRLLETNAGEAGKNPSIPETTPDARFERAPEPGALVLDCFSRVTEAHWPQARSAYWDGIRRRSTGRDALWTTAAETKALAAGRWPDSLTRRLARFHLDDNTRGEPPHWKAGEIRAAHITLTHDHFEGEFHLEGGGRSYRPKLEGILETEAGHVRRLDLLAQGPFEGEGRYTSRGPEGEFTLTIAATLATPGPPPQGARDTAAYFGQVRGR